MTPKSDDNLLCTAGDTIDNASYGALCDVLYDDENKVASVEDALKALCVDSKTAVSDHVNEAIDAINDVIKEYNLKEQYPKGSDPDGEDLEWNIEYIAEVTSALESILSAGGVNICHPWQDENEHICYSVCDRCGYCTRS